MWNESDDCPHTAHTLNKVMSHINTTTAPLHALNFACTVGPDHPVRLHRRISGGAAPKIAEWSFGRHRANHSRAAASPTA